MNRKYHELYAVNFMTLTIGSEGETILPLQGWGGVHLIAFGDIFSCHMGKVLMVLMASDR